MANNPYEYRGRGEGFLDDYSNMNAAGAAFQGFSEAFERGQDAKQKRLEQAAQVEALKAKADRDKFQSQMDAAKEGYSQGADGQLQEAPLSPKVQGMNALKAIGEGVKASGFDLNGNPTGYETDASSPKMKGIEAQIRGREIRIDQSDDTKDRREHERVLTRINSNPAAKQKLQQNQGLENALSIITQSDHITPEQIHEFQQAVRGNMGMKGSGGVGEREETYFKSLNLNAARWKEFLTGEPASIAKDSKLLDHFRQLAAIEQANIRKQYDKAVNAASGGHGSMYSRRSDLKQDLNDALSAQRDQFADQPQGLVPKGLVKPGMVGGGQAPAPADGKAAALAQTHPEKDAAKVWATGVLQDKNATPEDKAKAQAILARLGG